MNIKGTFVFVDFSKAFDLLELNFLFYIILVSTILLSHESKQGHQTYATNNDWSSQPFENCRGNRQGCP